MRKNILVVDDDAMNLKMAQFILKQNKYDVHLTESGMECLNYLKECKPDLILLDIEMPVMNGFKTLEAIKENEKLTDIPVIFLTASDDPNTVLEAQKLGVIDYIKKPFLPQDLLTRVGNAIS